MSEDPWEEDEHDDHHHHDGQIPPFVKMAIIVAITGLAALIGYLGRG